MDESLPCIINLIKLMVNYNDPQNSPEFFSLVESIITEDIVKGLSLSIGKSTTAVNIIIYIYIYIFFFFFFFFFFFCLFFFFFFRYI